MSVEIELRAARVRYGPLEALHGVDLPFAAGELSVLLGRNGSGRTTVLRALAGTVPLGSGRVMWRGRDVTGVPAHARALRGLALVPNRAAVFGSLTVADQLALCAPGGAYGPALAAYPPLRALLGHRGSTLSGGEQRMLAVARALLTSARLLLLDEPTQGMSPAVAARTHLLLGAVTGAAGDGGAQAATADAGTGGVTEVPAGIRTGRTVVVAEQALSPALRRAATFVYELRRGTLAFAGEPAEVPEPETG
ncbi:ATP-binding cassette domain-containing protein [Streptomyces sp. MST-110588]|uniref:ATP-binding cassette domain-containing protein n=1 Tax=Streptomyces sp. MST-110588 TaxID=2833628 RepID=UPI001F5C96E3|nr:ATP-binding cassette domain-containing protein [Streptomyces sp. MST-110588]UNO42860.1 ATP-binding cassette domain-containing protein [Streptomyces sp. MST-110588]